MYLFYIHIKWIKFSYFYLQSQREGRIGKTQDLELEEIIECIEKTVKILKDIKFLLNLENEKLRNSQPD